MRSDALRIHAYQQTIDRNFWHFITGLVDETFSFTYSGAMNEEGAVSRRPRITDFLGLTDSPRVRARTIEKTTPTELLIRAIGFSALVIFNTVVILIEQDKGFVWFLLADLGFACIAVLAWVRWGRYRNV